MPGPAGKRQQRTKNFANAKEAKAFAARQTTEVELKGVGDPQKRSFGSYLRSWLATLRDRAELSPVTINGYERHAEMLMRELGTIPLEKLTAGEIEAGLGRLRQGGGKVQKRLKKGAVADSRPLAPRTVHHVFSVCHNALEQARKWRLVGENVARDVKPPAVGKSEATAYAATDIDKLYDAARSPEMVLAIALLATTGMRRGELLGLAFDAIDMANATITIKRTVIEARLDGVRTRIVRSDCQDEILASHLLDRPRARRHAVEHRKRLLETALALGPTLRARAPVPVPRPRWPADHAVPDDAAARCRPQAGWGERRRSRPRLPPRPRHHPSGIGDEPGRGVEKARTFEPRRDLERLRPRPPAKRPGGRGVGRPPDPQERAERSLNGTVSSPQRVHIFLKNRVTAAQIGGQAGNPVAAKSLKSLIPRSRPQSAAWPLLVC